MSGYTLGHRQIYYIGDPESSSLADLTTSTGGPVKYSDIVAQYSSANQYTDPDFPCDQSSIGPISLDSANAANDYPNWDKTFQWFRAQAVVANITGNPAATVQFASVGTIQDTFSRLEVRQGSLGDCWFLACVSAVSINTDLIKFIAPDDNNSNNGSGAYHFRIFHLGIWIDVVVDDYLPCAEFFGPGQGWYALASKPPVIDSVGEIWPSLLEKAYAKLNGSYGNIESNIPLTGFEDLTAGIGEEINLGTTLSDNPNIYQILTEVTRLGSFVALSSIAPKGALQPADFDAVCLHYPHAYSVTGLAVVHDDGVETQLVRARNPWGNSAWNGAWSDKSPEWQSVDTATKKRIGLVVADDGEFWISISDVVKYFSTIGVCYWVSEDSYTADNSVFDMQLFNGAWSNDNGTTGGAYAPAANPQYAVTVVGGASGQGILVVGIQIKAAVNDLSVEPYVIMLYKVGDPSQYSAPYGQDFFNDWTNNGLVQPGGNVVTEGDPYFTYNREPRTATGFRLDPGTYVVVPALMTPGTEAQFVLHLAAQKSSQTLLSTPAASGGETTLASLVLEA